jgi:hypothetical protein
VPTSRRARVLDYLGSAPNLIGSALGLVALFIAGITGLGGVLWPALILLGLRCGRGHRQAHLRGHGSRRRYTGRYATAPRGQVTGPGLNAIPQKLTLVALGS